MAVENVTRIYYFELIALENKQVAYGKRFEESVERGKHANRIGEVAQGGKLPGEIHAHDLHGDSDDLSIYGSSHETCAYVFRLNALVEAKQRLEFASSQPFLPLPLNSSAGEEFLVDMQTYDGEPGRWASFVCDHRAVRVSTLADRIRELSKGHHGENEPIRMKLPFIFNVVDPVLGAAPWVVPEEAKAHGHGLGIVIHGGVHPKTLASVVVEI